jgi:hypothetical protein
MGRDQRGPTDVTYANAGRETPRVPRGIVVQDTGSLLRTPVGNTPWPLAAFGITLTRSKNRTDRLT